MRVMFFGTSEFAVPSLERLAADGHAVVLCVTQPDRPQGRGLKVEPSPVKRAALRLTLPLLQPERLRGDFGGADTPEVGVVAAYGQLIPSGLLRRPTHGMLGVHPSLLPKYRGAAPVAWAILNGESETGVSLFRLNERLDAGDVLLRQTVAVNAQDTTEMLTRRLAVLGAEVLSAALRALAGGSARGIPQDESHATFAPKLTKAQGRIDWRQPAEAIVRLVRATVPWPGAATAWQGHLLKVWAAAPDAGAGAPGTVLQASGERLLVAAGHGAVALTALQPAGGRHMQVREFLAGHRVQPGDVFV